MSEPQKGNATYNEDNSLKAHGFDFNGHKGWNGTYTFITKIDPGFRFKNQSLIFEGGILTSVSSESDWQSP